MMTRGLNYANVMATIAVFIALGGGAYAAKVSKNSVGGAQIKKNAVGSSEVKSNAVGADEIATGAVGSAEVIDDSLLGADIAEGSLGTVPRADTLDGLDSSAFQRAGAGPGTAVGGTVATSSSVVLFELAEGTLELNCNGSLSTLVYSNDSGAVATVFNESGIHTSDSDPDPGGVDLDGTDGLEDVNPGRLDVGNGLQTAFPLDGGVAAGAQRGMRLAILTDQHAAFLEAFVNTAGGCSYLAELRQYAL